MGFLASWKRDRYFNAVRTGKIPLDRVVSRIRENRDGDDTQALWRLFAERLAERDSHQLRKIITELSYIENLPEFIVDHLAKWINAPDLTTVVAEALGSNWIYYNFENFPRQYYIRDVLSDSRSRLLIVLGAADFMGHPEQGVAVVKHFGQEGLPLVEDYLLQRSGTFWHHEGQVDVFCNAMTFYYLADGRPSPRFVPLLQEALSFTGKVRSGPSVNANWSNRTNRALDICSLLLEATPEVMEIRSIRNAYSVQYILKTLMQGQSTPDKG